MSDIKIRQRKLLDETVNHFNKNNRASVFDKMYSRCKYSHEYNGGCAIGRLLSREAAEECDRIGGTVLFPIIVDLLPPEVRELDVEFLREIQILHDDMANENWNDDGLSEQGFDKYKSIIALYNLPEIEKQ